MLWSRFVTLKNAGSPSITTQRTSTPAARL
jgi:hypothetical protein